ncbi:MAG: response regulator [Mongoliibacter sp.]|uniref:response regulator n=1 Tax=Mongoliibacter sp. TaxID=2022438 RepID=UPI0012F15D55|nr:hybrid sensor histidine kinase/response regulator [Mongoliibacter sp.]TVP48097.1 MAG: response regulator [Mongoliibacter sp.]
MKNKKVLIVDDNALNRRVFENIIGQMYQFESAENGSHAIKKLKENSYDLILMDIQMPIIDGINTLKTIGSDQLSNAPVIAVSAFASKDDKDYFLSTGFDDFIPKPVKPKVLLETIHRLIQQNEQGSNESSIDWETFEILDDKVVKQLMKYNNIDNINLVYEDFFEESERLLSDIEALIRVENFPEIGGKLHILKGNSGTLGAMQLFKFSESFEKNIKNSNFDTTFEEYLYLRKLYSSFKKHFQSNQLFHQ